MEYWRGRARTYPAPFPSAPGLWLPPCFVLQETIASLESKHALATQELESYR